MSMTSTVSEIFRRHAAAGGLAQETAHKKKDKMEQTKRREREIKEARKMELNRQKAEREKERQDKQATMREERQFHETKRAHKEKRIQERREERRNNGVTCEHGIWKCKICFPRGAAS